MLLWIHFISLDTNFRGCSSSTNLNVQQHPCKREIVNSDAIVNAEVNMENESFIAGKFKRYLCDSAISSFKFYKVRVN